MTGLSDDPFSSSCGCGLSPAYSDGHMLPMYLIQITLSTMNLWGAQSQCKVLIVRVGCQKEFTI
jgi:hypothetical protein